MIITFLQIVELVEGISKGNVVYRLSLLVEGVSVDFMTVLTVIL